MASSPKQTRKFIRPLAIAALASTSLWQPLLPAFAVSPAAGTNILNRATATFSDDEGNNFDVTSNEVTITVAEVAGITVTAQTPVDLDGGAALEGDNLRFDFEITNTGNADSNIFIPDAADIGITGLATSDIQSIEYSVDGGNTFFTRPVDGIIDFDPSTPGSVEPVPADASIIVRVEVQIPTGTNLSVGDEIRIELGNTSGNTGSQNVADSEDGTQANEVRTENVGAELPANGEREASDLSDAVQFGGGVTPPDLALAQVTKTSSATPNDPTAVNDDEITYSLGLNIFDQDPADPDQFTPGELEGTPINLQGAIVNRVLVADRIPENTSLQSINTSSLPAGWSIVVSTDSSLTRGAIEPNPNATVPTASAVEWQNFNAASTDLSTVTRIGFIYDASATPLAAGDSVTGFEFTVVTDGFVADAASISVSNIAQVFGQTVGDTSNEVVFDESGDVNPNNYDGTTPPDSTGTNYDPNDSADVSGVADPNVEGIDSGNDNTGDGVGGEANVVNVIRVIPIAPADNILNGTELSAAAVGPTDDNDDFTNLSVALAAGTDVSSPGVVDVASPGSVTFTNTVSNPSSSGSLNDVTIEPLLPSEADVVGNAGQDFGDDGDLLPGTTVTITWDNNTPGDLTDDLSATYTYTNNAGTFSWQTADTPVNIGALAPNASETYTVTVTLPANTPVLNSYSVPVVAFPDDNVNAGVGDGFTNESISNVTIDRIFTGFMQVSKQARVIDTNGDVISSGRGSNDNGTPAGDVIGSASDLTIGWSTDFSDLDIQEGQSIEYRIQYENLAVAEPPTASNNVEINASNFVIDEDGNQSGPNGNNWATFTTHQQNTQAGNTTTVIFTTSTGTPTTVNNFTAGSDPASGTDVERYQNDVGTVGSGESGEFIFRRQIDAQ